MKENFENSPENILQNIADDLSTITGTCTEIKETQLNCATTNDLKECAEKVENILQEGVIPAVNKVNELIKNPPTYNIEMKTDGLAENIKNGLSEAVKADLYKSVDKVIKDGISSTYAQSVSYLKNAVNDLRYEVNRIISGHWWLAMPKWAKIAAIVSVLAAIGFAIGFFYMVSEIPESRVALSLRAHELQCRRYQGYDAPRRSDDGWLQAGTGQHQGFDRPA